MQPAGDLSEPDHRTACREPMPVSCPSQCYTLSHTAAFPPRDTSVLLRCAWCTGQCWNLRKANTRTALLRMFPEAGKGCTAEGWPRGRTGGCCGEKRHHGKTPAGQEQCSTLAFIIESNPRNPVQIPIVSTQGGIPSLALLLDVSGGHRSWLGSNKEQASSQFLLGWAQPEEKGQAPAVLPATHCSLDWRRRAGSWSSH